MDIFDSRYYKINKFFWSGIGWWSYQTKVKKRLAQIGVALAHSHMIPHVFYLYKLREDLDGLLDDLPPFLLGIMTMCYLFLYVIYEEMLVQIFTWIKNDWQKWSSGMELEILRNSAETGRFFTLMYAVIIYGCVVIVTSISLTNPILDALYPLNESRPREQLFGCDIPYVDEDDNFLWILAYCIITGSYVLSVLFSFESLLAVTIMHACGLFKIISYRLEKITEHLKDGNMIKDEKLSDLPNVKELIFNEMLFLIELHKYALQYSDTLKTLFSPFLFFTIGNYITVLCISGLQILYTLSDIERVFKFGCYAMIMLSFLYCLALPPQKLLDYSADVAVKAYQVPWYNMPLKSKKLIVLFIMRSQTPSTITAGKFYTMDMITFSALLQTTISSLTVLFSLK